MIKLVALYKRPADPSEFDRLYFDNHLPLARQMPDLQRVEVARIVGEGEYYLITELYFPDLETAKASMASVESRAAGKQLMTFAKDLVSFHVAQLTDGTSST